MPVAWRIPIPEGEPVAVRTRLETAVNLPRVLNSISDLVVLPPLTDLPAPRWVRGRISTPDRGCWVTSAAAIRQHVTSARQIRGKSDAGPVLNRPFEVMQQPLPSMEGVLRYRIMPAAAMALLTFCSPRPSDRDAPASGGAHETGMASGDTASTGAPAATTAPRNALALGS